MERVGFAGLGTMGSSMALNIRRAGFPLVVWNRTPGKAADLVDAGAAEAETPAAVARASDIVVTCVSDTPDVEAILFGDDGIAEGVHAGMLLVDCSTISQFATRTFGERLAALDVAMVDAPVSGGSEGARGGTLTIFAGGDAGAVARAHPILAAMGRTITHIGPLGSGQAAKAVNQVILSGTYLGVAEGMVLAIKAGLDAPALVTALSGGSARSWVLENRSGRMIDNEYPLGFRVELHLKDLGIALGLARETGATLPVTALAAQLENGLVATGHGDDDMSALARAIRRLSGLD